MRIGSTYWLLSGALLMVSNAAWAQNKVTFLTVIPPTVVPGVAPSATTVQPAVISFAPPVAPVAPAAATAPVVAPVALAVVPMVSNKSLSSDNTLASDAHPNGTATTAVATPMPNLPPVTLPGTTVPTVAFAPTTPPPPGTAPVPTAPMPTAATVTPAIAANEQTIPPTGHYSFGTATNSLFFTPDEIKQMKAVLERFESGAGNNGKVADITVMAPAAATAVEPTSYPMFYLSSVAFHNTHDWTVWLLQSNDAAPASSATPAAPNPAAPVAPAPAVPGAPATAAADVAGQRMIKLTPHTNTGEITVVAIGPDRVAFSWKPEYLSLIAQRSARHMFAATDKVKHRLTQGHQVSFKTTDKDVRFWLRENQSFVPAYFETFEGHGSNTPLESLAPPAPPTDASAAPAAVSTDAVPMNPTNLPAGEDLDSLLSRSSVIDKAKKAGASSAP